MYRITFVTDLFNGPVDRAESHQVLEILLNALFQIDMAYLRNHPNTPRIYQAGVRYQEEVAPQEDWRDIPTCLRERTLDCEEAACWRAAELNVRDGIKAVPIYSFRTLPNGDVVYHIRVQYPNGQIEDPSRVLGMR